MKASLMQLQKLLLLVLFECTTRASGESWAMVWNKMQTNDLHINYKSSCPWKYVKDPITRHFRPQLLQIEEKSCYQCCIDLNQSNSTAPVVNPTGQCSPIKAKQCNGPPVVVGFTCVYAYSMPTDKRNEGPGPIVNSRITYVPTNQNIKSQSTTEDWDKKTPTSNTKKDPEKKDEFNKEQQQQHDKYTTAMSQHFVPPFLGNVNYHKLPFLENSSGNFRPGFLNGLNAQVGRPPLMPMFPLTENMNDMRRNIQARQGSNVDEETEYFPNEAGAKSDNQKEVEEKGEYQDFKEKETIR